MSGGEIELARTLASTGGGFWASIFIAILLAIPVIIKITNWAKAENASGVLYAQLSERVTKQQEELDKVTRERNEFFSKLTTLEAQVAGLEDTKRIFDVLKGRLEQKDQIIAERDARIVSLTREVMSLKDRIHSLELRLQADEREFCRACNHPNPKPLVTV